MLDRSSVHLGEREACKVALQTIVNEGWSSCCHSVVFLTRIVDLFILFWHGPSALAALIRAM